MTKKKFSGKKFVKGLLVGGAIGGTAALLLAPRSGKETRDNIQQEIDDTIQMFLNVKDSSEAVVFNAQHLKDLTETMIPEFTEDIEKSIERFQFKSKYRIEDIKQQLAKIQNEMDNFKNSIE